MSFLRRVAGRSLRDKVRSSATREELRVEPLLLDIERSQVRWLRHLFRMPPGLLPREVVENSVLLKCRKLRREDQETSDWIVSRISLFYDMSLVSVVIEISS